MLRSLLTAAALAALTACAATPAAPVKTAMVGPVPTRETGYLEPSALTGRTILSPPPTADSPQGRAERALYDETRRLEGSERWRTAIQDNDLWGGGALKRFSCAAGVEIDERQTPTAVRILRKIELDVRTVGGPAKSYFDRDRPMIGNDKAVCVPREDWMKTNKSYPSGHAMTAWAWALVLTELAPAKADALLKVGREGGESRVICGVHFTSDIEAGRTLGSAMVARLHADPAFEADLARARRELAAARTRPASCPA